MTHEFAGEAGIELQALNLPMPVAATFVLIDQEQNDNSSSSSDGSFVRR